MSDYPLGAKYDIRAPYNRKTVRKQLLISVTLSKSIEVEIEEGTDPECFDEIAQESFNGKVLDKFIKEKGWDIDEYIVIDDD